MVLQGTIATDVLLMPEVWQKCIPTFSGWVKLPGPAELWAALASTQAGSLGALAVSQLQQLAVFRTWLQSLEHTWDVADRNTRIHLEAIHSVASALTTGMSRCS